MWKQALLPTYWNWVQHLSSSQLILCTSDVGLFWCFQKDFRLTLQSNEATWADFFVWQCQVWVAFFCWRWGYKISCYCAVPPFIGSWNSSACYHTLDFSFTMSLMPFPGGKNPFCPGQKSSFLFNNVFYTKCLELKLNSPACKHYFLLFENQNCICLPPDFCPSLIIHNSV